MTRTNPFRSFLLFTAAVLGVSFLLSSMHCLGSVAHGATVVGDPVVVATPPVDPGGLLGLLLSGHYLPAIGGAMVLAVGLARAGLGSVIPWFKSRLGGYVLAYVTAYALYLGTAWYAGAPWDARLLLTALAVALTSSGVLDHWRDVIGAVAGGAGAGKAAGAAAVLAVLLLGGLAGSGCGARQRTANGVTTGLHCEEPAIAATVAQLLPSLVETVGAAITGDGLHVDKAKLKAAAQPLKDSALQCALEAAIAAMATPAPKQPGAPAAAPMVVDGAALRATWASVRGELGWAPVAGTP